MTSRTHDQHIGLALARVLILLVLPTLQSETMQMCACDVRVDPSNFSVLVSSSSTLDLRILESLHILKTKSPLNNQLSSHSLSIVNSIVMYVLPCFPPFRSLFPGAVDESPKQVAGRLLCVFSDLFYIIFFTAISVLISSYSLLIAMLNCLPIHLISDEFIVNFLVEDGYVTRNVLIKDIFHCCFCSPVYILGILTFI